MAVCLHDSTIDRIIYTCSDLCVLLTKVTSTSIASDLSQTCQVYKFVSTGAEGGSSQSSKQVRVWIRFLNKLMDNIGHYSIFFYIKPKVPNRGWICKIHIIQHRLKQVWVILLKKNPAGSELTSETLNHYCCALWMGRKAVGPVCRIIIQ